MKGLSFKVKILLLTLVPLLLLGLATTLLGLYQTSQLGNNNLSSFSEKIYDLRRAELKNYTEIAHTAVEKFVNSNDPDASDKAKDILRTIRFGDDGYMFVYDYQGVNLMHPIKPQLEGRNLWQLEDENGVKLIQKLVANAQVGGGFTDYLWDKPSKGENIDKIGYSMAVDKWDWMLGTGLYVDDLDEAIATVRSKVNQQVFSAGMIMATLAFSITGIFAFIGFRFTAHESDMADTKLRAMAFKASSSKETERSRVARELQKSVNSHLVLAKQRARDLTDRDGQLITKGDMISVEQEVSEAIKQIYRVIGQLRPPELDQGGLSVALKALTRRISKDSDCDISFHVSGRPQKMRWEIEVALYRAANLAIDNIVRHADVDHAEVWLNLKSSMVRVTIKDQGVGFDVKRAMVDDGHSDSSLNEIETLVGSLGGKMNVFSTPSAGSIVRFEVPLAQPKSA
jgi:two-component system NarL family sensor kinase